MLIFNPIEILKRQWYWLQLENFSISRFLLVFSKKWSEPISPPRKEIVWTGKLRLVAMLALFLQSFISSWSALWGMKIFLNFNFSFWLVLIFLFFWASFFYFLIFFHFTFLVLSLWLLGPSDFLFKYLIISSAKKKIGRLSHLTIIGVAGSYGKTTVKEVLSAVLSTKFKVVKTPDNINTPLGVSRIIRRDLNSQTDIFIAEMGAYKRGDIKRLCFLAPPSISVLTGINESHLERFKTMQNTVSAKFELITHTHPKGRVILNADNDWVLKEYEKYLGERKVFFYGSTQHSKISYEVRNKTFFEDGSGTAFEFSYDGDQFHYVKVPFLADYIIGVIGAVWIIGRELRLTDNDIVRGLALLRPVPHRLEVLIRSGNILVIDDSYNANPDGVREAINVLAKFKTRRKVYVTPGLVEMGSGSSEIHQALGRQLAGVADLVVLIKNSSTPFMAQGLKSSGFPESNIIWYNSSTEVFGSTAGFVRSGDVVMFQNDWPDNYT